jgi:hypothetical protein
MSQAGPVKRQSLRQEKRKRSGPLLSRLSASSSPAPTSPSFATTMAVGCRPVRASAKMRHQFT